MLLLLACTNGSGVVLVDDSTPPDVQDSPTDTSPDSPVDTEPVDTGPFPVAEAGATPQAGDPPLKVEFSARGSTTPTPGMEGSWILSDGTELPGLDPEHIFEASGAYTATLTIRDDLGRESTDTVPVWVRSETCPTTGPPEVLGTLIDPDLDEVSGLAVSRLNPGVLWVHNDAGDTERVFALGTDGAVLGRYTLDVAHRDWEDMALAEIDGVWHLVVGDIGDNARAREEIRVYLVPEPAVTPGQEPVDVDLTAVTLTLTYPELEAHDAESLAVDPRTGDVLVITKNGTGPARVYAKPAPHIAGTSELVLVHALDFSTAPLAGSATTAADVSPDGTRLLIRTYSTRGFLWQIGPEQSLADALAGIPCEIELPDEVQSETVAWDPSGDYVWTISERVGVDVNRTPVLPAQ